MQRVSSAFCQSKFEQIQEDEFFNHIDTEEEDKPLILNEKMESSDDNAAATQEQEEDDEDVVGNSYLNDSRVTSRRSDMPSNMEADQREKELMQRGDEIEKLAFGDKTKEFADNKDGDGPVQKTQNPSEEA